MILNIRQTFENLLCKSSTSSWTGNRTRSFSNRRRINNIIQTKNGVRFSTLIKISNNIFSPRILNQSLCTKIQMHIIQSWSNTRRISSLRYNAFQRGNIPPIPNKITRSTYSITDPGIPGTNYLFYIARTYVSRIWQINISCFFAVKERPAFFLSPFSIENSPSN